MTTKEILNVMKHYNNTDIIQDRLYYFGIRGDDKEITLGELLDDSFGWDYENDRQSTTEKLNGTSAVGIKDLWLMENDSPEEDEEDLIKIEKAIKYFEKNYNYNHISVIGGKDAERGEDENETVIDYAKVIYIIK